MPHTQFFLSQIQLILQVNLFYEFIYIISTLSILYLKELVEDSFIQIE